MNITRDASVKRPVKILGPKEGSEQSLMPKLVEKPKRQSLNMENFEEWSVTDPRLAAGGETKR